MSTSRRPARRTRARHGDPLEMLVELSHALGADPALALGGGGNTSVKLDDRLLVKSSGSALATIGPEGFVDLDRTALQELLEKDLGGSREQREAVFKQAVLAARREPERGQRPSVESVLHHLMPGRFVAHLHATRVNEFGCCRIGGRLVGDSLSEDVLWVDAVDPGLALAKALQDGLRAFERRTGKHGPRAVIIQNHGMVVGGETPDEIRDSVAWLIEALSELKERAGVGAPAEAPSVVTGAGARALINAIGPALRGLLGSDDRLGVVTFDDSAEALGLVGSEGGRGTALGGPLTPDQIVYCGSFPLWFETQAGEPAPQLIGRLAAAVEDHEGRFEFPPKIVLVQGLGLFARGESWSEANTARLVYLDAIKVMNGARALGGIAYLDADFRGFIEHWEVESYRKQVASPSGAAGHAAGKIALVTGAAQGFGLEIAEDLAAQGAHVALCDVNVEGVLQAAADLDAALGHGRAIGLAIDVTSTPSVADALHQVVRTYGGLDVLVSNAGVLRAGSVRTQPEEDFDLTTAVNYKGYFLCVQQTAPILAIQHAVRPGYWSDIIQINSKSGLEGSNRNFAYSGSKFGGIGLTQSFALELVTDGIKVNSICPGNFLDGPLWSDPRTGLFVQYLRTGKVPGASSVEDVRRFYESKVPMGRGCTTADVMKAVYYLIEQRYETGQALPVTGGQVMLA